MDPCDYGDTALAHPHGDGSHDQMVDDAYQTGKKQDILPHYTDWTNR